MTLDEIRAQLQQLSDAIAKAQEEPAEDTNAITAIRLAEIAFHVDNALWEIDAEYVTE